MLHAGTLAVMALIVIISLLPSENLFNLYCLFIDLNASYLLTVLSL